jgi:branched-chain amino acid transport system ATP-binding protein
MTALLEVQDAAVHFGGVKALDGVSLSVERGSLCGLIGPNGSGKSTLLGAMSRLTDLTSGSLTIAGEEYTRVPRYRANAVGIARTFQTVRLLESMTVLANVMIGAATRAVQRGALSNWLVVTRARADNRAARGNAERALERVGMTDFAGAYPQDLPYGHQRHVEIARALASEPQLLLLDEPTAGMNHAERDEVGDLLIALNRDGLTQVLVEHDLAMIHRVCSHTFALNFGKVIAEGTPSEVSRTAAVREAYLGHGAVGALAAESSKEPQR